MNTGNSIVSSDRIEQAIRQRYSPFAEMTMESLVMYLNQFRIGELRGAARIWEIMMERDGELSTPYEKLCSDIARLNIEVEKCEESAEADAHYASLKYFVDNLTARSVLDGDEIGGSNLLVRQMMSAQAFRYSVHEMVLRVNSASKREVTADFNHCPVWFFEARKGRLGYLKGDYDLYGVPLERGQWLTAVGAGKMRQCSVAWVSKWQCTASFLLFCYRFGVPGIHGEFNGSEDSPEGLKFAEALKAFASDWATATYGGVGNAKINLIESAKGSTGSLPFPEIIESANRLFARSFRGGDLSTQSREGGDVAGSNAQEGEKRIVLEDGGSWVTDNLNAGVTEPLIAYLYNATPKAWFVVRPPKQTDANREINTLKAARELGIPVSIETARERLELPMPEDGEELIGAAARPATPPTSPPGQGEGEPGDTALENEDAQRAAVSRATASVLQPILAAYDERLQRILTITDPVLRRQRWQEVQAELAALEADHLADPIALVRAFEQINTKAFVAGLDSKTT